MTVPFVGYRRNRGEELSLAEPPTPRVQLREEVRRVSEQLLVSAADAEDSFFSYFSKGEEDVSSRDRTRGANGGQGLPKRYRSLIVAAPSGT